MFKHLFSLTLFGLLASLLPASGQSTPAPRPRLNYHLAWDDRVPQVQVRLVYSAATPDSTVFTFGNPAFGGQPRIFDVVSDIGAPAPDQVLVRAAQRQIVVRHHRPGLHTLTYRVNNALAPAPAAPTSDDLKRIASSERFRPTITPGRLYLVSSFLLLEAEQHPATTYRVQWDAFPARTPYFFSPAPAARPRQQRVLSRKAAGYFLLVAGPELQIARQRGQAIPYYAITSRRDSVNHPAQLLAPFLTRYLPTIQDYWHEALGPYYYLNVLPLHWPPTAPPTEHVMGGVGLANGFVAVYGGPLDLLKFKTIIAHETSHTWLGGKLLIGNDSFAHQWFGEGFNDYVCLVNLVRAGMADDDFVPYVNEQVLRPHYTSPVRHVPNDSIAAKFWLDAQYQKLPYRRGFIYAFYLDNQIRLATAGRASLRDCLLRLLHRSQQLRAANPDAPLTLADFVEAASAFLPRQQVEQDLNRYIVQGEPLDLTALRLLPGWRVSQEQGVPVLHLVAPATVRELNQ